MENKRWKKRICIFGFAASLLLTMLPVPVLANPADEQVGEQTEETVVIPDDAIHISTVEDVENLVENCRLNTWSVGKIFVLDNDINMSGVDFDGIPTFGGIFLGQGYKISGFDMQKEGSAVGFFRYLQKTAVVDSLILDGVFQPTGSKSTVGAIAGNNAGTIKNCTVHVVISGSDKIGGIVGNNESSGVVEGCTVTGVVYGNHFVGGVTGENHGVVRNCTNEAQVNTTSVQNVVELEDITMSSLRNTESANTATDIGGIAGISSGVIRECVNKGEVGYQSMGYNVGGIAGTQNGYVVACVNYAKIEGRKEVGGIVGHMEPNIVVDFDRDSLEQLSSQMNSLSDSVSSLKNSVETGNENVVRQVAGLEEAVKNVQNSAEALADAMNSGSELPDEDRIIAAWNDLSDSLNDVYTQTNNIQNAIDSSSKNTLNQLGSINNQLNAIGSTLSNIEEGVRVEIEDVSGDDTEEDTFGKAANCINYGEIVGNMNIGGIAGIMAEENDMDDYNDISVYGDASLNVNSQVRVVIRDCQNFGTIEVSKQYGGGVVGYMLMGATIESINCGDADAINADYVGGVVGASNGIVRDCSSKSVIAGDTYVGGIAGSADKVTGCYAFISIEAYTEKAGGIIGYTSNLPGEEESEIAENYYFSAREDIGGIDGISYENAAEKKTFSEFLEIPELEENFKLVNIHFKIDGQEDVVITVNTGENLDMDKLPVLNVDADSEYDWEYIPNVTSEELGMGETATTEYISEELLTNILFNQTYEVSYKSKNTVISAENRNAQNLTILLGEGTFIKDTKIQIADALNEKSSLNEITLLENWDVSISNSGVTKLHYLLSDDIDPKKTTLYIKDASGQWEERAFEVDESYIVFEFNDGELGFALQEKQEDYRLTVLFMIFLVGLVIGKTLSKRKRYKGNKKKEA